MTSDHVKSLIAASFLLFLIFVVLEGEIVRRRVGLFNFRYGVSYCHRVEGVPVLGDLPCFIVNWAATILVYAIFIGGAVMVLIVARRFSR